MYEALPTISNNKRSFLPYYMALLSLAFAGPIVFALYAVAIWSLTAYIGLTKSFPWSAGPLSNCMLWLGLALLSNLVLVRSARQLSW